MIQTDLMELSARVSAYLSYAYRIFFLILGFVLFSLLTPNVTHAANSSYANSNVESNVPQNQHTHAQAVTIEVMTAIICQLSGVDMMSPETGCLGINPQTGKLGYAQSAPGAQPQLGGLLGMVPTLYAGIYAPPASSSEYFQDLASNFGIVKTAHAQEGTEGGFTALNAIQGLFKTSRNLVYLLYILAFVLIGMGIMLRFKIDPKTVMTIQNMLPRIVVSLILVTFSYAIVGFLVDAMWVVTYFGINTVASSSTCSGNGKSLDYVATVGLLDNPILYVSNIFSESGCFGSFDGLTGLSQKVGLTMGSVVANTVLEATGLSGDLADTCRGGIMGAIFDAGDCISDAIFGFLKYVTGALLMIIVLAALLIALFKVWFMLLKAYIYVIIDLVTAPFWILAGLKPDSTLGFENWLRHLGSRLLLFPATAVIFVFAFVVASNDQINNPTLNNVFVPPLVANPSIADNLGYLIAFGIILIAPQLLDMIMDALKSPRGKYAGPAVAGGMAAGSAAGMALPKAYGSRLMRWDPHKGETGLIAGAIRKRTGGTEGPVSRMFKYVSGTRKIPKEDMPH